MALFRMRSHHSIEGHTFEEDAGLRYLPVESAMLRCRWPKVGWGARWMPATVVGATAEAVEVEWDHPHWIDWADGERVSAPRHQLALQHVMRLPPAEQEGGSCPSLGGWEPMLSVVEVRWGDLRRPIEFHPDSWGSVGSSVSPAFIGALHEAFHRLGGAALEVLSVFASRSSDLDDLSETFVRAQLRGRHLAGLYFLWAAHAGDQADAGYGYVEPAALFGLMRRLESVGIPTQWPHPSHLAELLASKAWVPAGSLDPACRVPATTKVGRAAVMRDPLRAARTALQRLRPLAESQGLLEAGEEQMTCVTKLGFSYEARAVVECVGASELANALTNVCDQFPFHDCVLVQARVPGCALELRVGVVRGHVANITYTRMGRVTETGYFCDFERLPRGEAVEQWLAGDEAALLAAEEQARELCARWWVRLAAEASEEPASARLDFLVRRTAAGAGEAWTCELGEQGYSSVGWEAFPRDVLPEVFAGCLQDADCGLADCGCQRALTAARCAAARCAAGGPLGVLAT